VAVVILRFWDPGRFLRLFEGDYFASLLLFVGVVLFALHVKPWGEWIRGAKKNVAAPQVRQPYVSILLAVFSAVLLCVLFSAWFDLSFTEAWLNAARWARFLPLFLFVLPYHLAEEFLLGPSAASAAREFGRLAVTLAIRLLLSLVLVAAIFWLHSGQILPVLLAPFFALFCLGQSWGMGVVREVTGSPSAAAVFGAILLAGFCLVVFPTT